MVRLQEVELDFGHMEHGRTEHGWTDRRGSRNIYLDWKYPLLVYIIDSSIKIQGVTQICIPWTMIKCKIKSCEGADYELSFVQLLLAPPINLMQSIQGNMRQNEI